MENETFPETKPMWSGTIEVLGIESTRQGLRLAHTHPPMASGSFIESNLKF